MCILFTDRVVMPYQAIHIVRVEKTIQLLSQYVNVLIIGNVKEILLLFFFYFLHVLLVKPTHSAINHQHSLLLLCFFLLFVMATL